MPLAWKNKYKKIFYAVCCDYSAQGCHKISLPLLPMSTAAAETLFYVFFYLQCCQIAEDKSPFCINLLDNKVFLSTFWVQEFQMNWNMSIVKQACLSTISALHHQCSFHSMGSNSHRHTPKSHINAHGFEMGCHVAENGSLPLRMARAYGLKITVRFLWMAPQGYPKNECECLFIYLFFFLDSLQTALAQNKSWLHVGTIDVKL